jgi:hypothetical protein
MCVGVLSFGYMLGMFEHDLSEFSSISYGAGREGRQAHH